MTAISRGMSTLLDRILRVSVVAQYDGDMFVFGRSPDKLCRFDKQKEACNHLGRGAGT